MPRNTFVRRSVLVLGSVALFAAVLTGCDSPDEDDKVILPTPAPMISSVPVPSLSPSESPSPSPSSDLPPLPSSSELPDADGDRDGDTPPR